MVAVKRGKKLDAALLRRAGTGSENLTGTAATAMGGRETASLPKVLGLAVGGLLRGNGKWRDTLGRLSARRGYG